MVSSVLAAAPETLWAHAVRPADLNREFRPLLRMTFPEGLEDLFASWRPGETRFRSWLLLGGLLPVDYDHVAFVEVELGRRFLERSTLLSQEVWEHERTIEPVPGGSRLTDRVRFAPRIPALAPLYARVFQAVFQLRHRNLRRIFGHAPAASR